VEMGYLMRKTALLCALAGLATVSMAGRALAQAHGCPCGCVTRTNPVNWMQWGQPVPHATQDGNCIKTTEIDMAILVDSRPCNLPQQQTWCNTCKQAKMGRNCEAHSMSCMRVNHSKCKPSPKHKGCYSITCCHGCSHLNVRTDHTPKE